jgi:hypothetical protein
MRARITLLAGGGMPVKAKALHIGRATVERWGNR